MENVSRKLKPFGGAEGGTMDLPFVIGHLESLVLNEEGEFQFSYKGPRAKRLDLVRDAIDLLNQACEMGKEE